MRFNVLLHTEALKELYSLNLISQNKVKRDFYKIENHGSEFVYIKPIEGSLYEIKTDNLRSLFEYKEGRIIVIAVIFTKTTKKTPKKYIEAAKRRLQDYD